MRAVLLPLFLPAALLTACADPLATPPAAGPSPSVAVPAPGTVPDGSTFLPYTPGATAVTYDPAVVPPGATARVAIIPTAPGVTVRLVAAGLVPRRAYGAHLHVRPCAAAPDAAGPHYQHRADPTTPSVDPAFANPRNEVWLDFTADAAGGATVTAEHPAFGPATPPRSLVLHASLTRTAAGEAGTAGPRVACLTLPA
jgi:Cu-Zn family superoxide dismutase